MKLDKAAPPLYKPVAGQCKNIMPLIKFLKFRLICIYILNNAKLNETLAHHERQLHMLVVR